MTCKAIGPLMPSIEPSNNVDTCAIFLRMHPVRRLEFYDPGIQPNIASNKDQAGGNQGWG